MINKTIKHKPYTVTREIHRNNWISENHDEHDLHGNIFAIGMIYFYVKHLVNYTKITSLFKYKYQLKNKRNI